MHLFSIIIPIRKIINSFLIFIKFWSYLSCRLAYNSIIIIIIIIIIVIACIIACIIIMIIFINLTIIFPLLTIFLKFKIFTQRILTLLMMKSQIKLIIIFFFLILLTLFNNILHHFIFKIHKSLISLDQIIAFLITKFRLIKQLI